MASPQIRPLDPNEPTYPADDDQPQGALDAATVDPDAAPAVVPGALDSLKYAAPASAIMRASLATDTPTKIKRYSTSMDVPESDFAVQDGNIVRRIPDADLPPQTTAAPQFARVEPSMFGGGLKELPGRAMDWAASGAGPAIPMAVGTAGAVVGSPTLAGAMALGGAGALTGEIFREGIDHSLANEPFTPDLSNIAGQTALGIAQPIIGAAAGKVLSLAGEGAKFLGRAFDQYGTGQGGWEDLAKPATDVLKSLTYDNPLDLNGAAWQQLRDNLSPEELADIGQLRQEAASHGVDLDLGQVTGNRALQVRMRQLLRYPETMTAATDFRTGQQRTQIPAAFLNAVNDILPAGHNLSPDDAISMFRDAGDDIFQKALDQRNAEAKINFGTALDRDPGTPGGPPLRFWNDDMQAIMDTGPGQKAVAYARKINNAIPDYPDNPRPKLTVPTYDGNGNLQPNEDLVPDWRSWDYIRQAMKGIIQTEGTNADGRLNPYGRQVNMTYKDLVGNLTEANPNLGHALALYGDSSDAVNAVTNGGVGFLNNMNGLDRQGILNRMFSPTSMTSEKLADARKVFYDAGKGDQWDGAANAWLRGKLDNALGSANVSQNLYSNLWEQPSDRAQAMAAIGDPDKIAKFERFMGVVNAARQYLPEGAPTATDLPEAQSGTGKAIGLVSKLFDASTYMNLGTNVTEGLRNVANRNYRTQLLNFLTTSDGDEALSRMAHLKPSSLAARQALGTVFARAGLAGIGVGQDSGQPPDYSPAGIAASASQ